MDVYSIFQELHTNDNPEHDRISTGSKYNNECETNSEHYVHKK